MIEKVLIAEDHESANISIQKTLEDLKIVQAEYVFYCDDALSKVGIAKAQGKPFDLLITDLYFEDDGVQQQLKDGEALIAAVRRIQPEIRIIIFSAEGRANIVDRLFGDGNIDGFVRKARNDAKELRAAILSVQNNQRYFPRAIARDIKEKNTYDFTELDIAIISLLADGVAQKDIPYHLKKKQIHPSGLSTVEKRLNNIRTIFDFNKNEQLIAFCKDMGII